MEVNGQELAKGGTHKKLRDRLNEIENEITKQRAQYDVVSDSLEAERNKIGEAEEAINSVCLIFRFNKYDPTQAFPLLFQLKNQRQQLENEFSAAQQVYTTVSSEHTALADALQSAENLQSTLLTGLSGSNNGASGFMGQLVAAKEAASRAKTQADLAVQQLKHKEGELREKEPEARRAKEESGGILRGLEEARRKLEELEAEMGRIGWSEEMEGGVEERKKVLGQEIAKLEKVSWARDVAARC